MRSLNLWLAVRITRGVGTMACAWIFALLALVSLPSVIATHNVIAIVSWISQNFLQLVLLSVIMVGQNIMGSMHADVQQKVAAIHNHLRDHQE